MRVWVGMFPLILPAPNRDSSIPPVYSVLMAVREHPKDWGLRRFEGLKWLEGFRALRFRVLGWLLGL